MLVDLPGMAVMEGIGMDSDDTFTSTELRIALTAFAVWLLRDEVGEGHEVELVDKFIQET